METLHFISNGEDPYPAENSKRKRRTRSISTFLNAMPLFNVPNIKSTSSSSRATESRTRSSMEIPNLLINKLNHHSSKALKGDVPQNVKSRCSVAGLKDWWKNMHANVKANVSSAGLNPFLDAMVQYSGHVDITLALLSKLIPLNELVDQPDQIEVLLGCVPEYVKDEIGAYDWGSAAYVTLFDYMVRFSLCAQSLGGYLLIWDIWAYEYLRLGASCLKDTREDAYPHMLCWVNWDPWRGVASPPNHRVHVRMSVCRTLFVGPLGRYWYLGERVHPQGLVEKGNTEEKEDDEEDYKVSSSEESDVFCISPPRHQHEEEMPIPQVEGLPTLPSDGQFGINFAQECYAMIGSLKRMQLTLTYIAHTERTRMAGQMAELNRQVDQRREFRGGGASSSSGAPPLYYCHTPVNFYAPYHPQPLMGFNVPLANVGGSSPYAESPHVNLDNDEDDDGRSPKRGRS
uniref:Aminotransferase-like plant mobile domain-containing protein n=1 Tax=Fagus sylvatica TaxID=28930 RepID=A0A2N9GKM7_FAGSY